MMTRSVYAAFDRYPSAKGAATHIEQASVALFSHSRAQPGALWVLDPDGDGAGEVSIGPLADGECFAVDAPAQGLLERSEEFASALGDWLEEQPDEKLAVGQFRDPWSGVPMIASGKFDRLVYEVNGLPSIEMPYRYPRLDERVVEKISHLEARCLEQADAIITPSKQTLRHLSGERGVPEEKITVIPNGAEVGPPRDRPAEAPVDPYLLYFGALQPWQGIHTLLRTFAQLGDLTDLRLVICGSHKEKHAEPFRKLAERLEVADRIVWRFQLPRPELQAWIQHASVTLAPLTDTPRNTVQGCCPLKVLESLAGATPVLASDLPVVRDLVEHLGMEPNDQAQSCGVILARPERPPEWATAIRIALEDPQKAKAIGKLGRERIEEKLTWSWHRAQLESLYDGLFG